MCHIMINLLQICHNTISNKSWVTWLPLYYILPCSWNAFWLFVIFCDSITETDIKIISWLCWSLCLKFASVSEVGFPFGSSDFVKQSPNKTLPEHSNQLIVNESGEHRNNCTQENTYICAVKTCCSNWKQAKTFPTLPQHSTQNKYFICDDLSKVKDFTVKSQAKVPSGQITDRVGLGLVCRVESVKWVCVMICIDNGF